jgi:protein TonB
MQALLSRTPSSGRYPRWGYLDRYAINPYMARAVAGAMLIQALAWGAYTALHKFNSQRHARVVRVTSGGIAGPAVLAQMPETSPARDRIPAPRIVPGPRPNSRPIPVDDNDPAVCDARGVFAAAGTGPYGVNGSAGVVDPLAGLGPVASWMPVEPRVDYVAFESAPELVAIDRPEYPEMAREARVEGHVVVLVLVGVDGFVKDARLADDGVPMLNEPALAAARAAVFRPALQSDQPVAAWIAIPIEFALRN